MSGHGYRLAMHRMGRRLRTGAHLLAIDACVAAVVTAGYVTLAGQGASDGLPRFSGRGGWACWWPSVWECRWPFGVCGPCQPWP